MKQHRLLLDQMIDAEAAVRLRAAGYDVVRTSDLGLAVADDAKILAHAILQFPMGAGNCGEWFLVNGQ